MELQVLGKVFQKGAGGSRGGKSCTPSTDFALPAHIQSENFTAPAEKLEEEFGINYDESAHGFAGFIHSSFPRFLWPQISTNSTTHTRACIGHY